MPLKFPIDGPLPFSPRNMCFFGLTEAVVAGSLLEAAVGTTAATGIVGAGIGAATGAIGSAVTGGNPLKGALFGGLTGGVASAGGAALSSTTSATEAGAAAEGGAATAGEAATAPAAAAEAGGGLADTTVNAGGATLGGSGATVAGSGAAGAGGAAGAAGGASTLSQVAKYGPLALGGVQTLSSLLSTTPKQPDVTLPTQPGPPTISQAQSEANDENEVASRRGALANLLTPSNTGTMLATGNTSLRTLLGG